MRRKAISGTIRAFRLIFLLVWITLFAFPSVVAYEWVHYIPSPSQVTLGYRKEGGVSYIDVSIWVPNTGFNFSDFGTPVFAGNNISADAQIWKWTGGSGGMILIAYYTYDLGNLPSGEYVFTLKVWSYPVKSLAFTVRITVPDDYATIQEAINKVPEGDAIYVKAGIYYESVVVNKTVSLIGDNKNTTIIDGDGLLQVVEIATRNVSFCNFTVQNGYRDIVVASYSTVSRFNVIRECILKEASFGMIFYGSIYDSHMPSEFNSVERNIIETTYGIELDDSDRNWIANNIIRNGAYGIYVDGYSEDNVITNNTLENIRARGEAITLMGSNVTIIGNTFKSNDWGLFIYGEVTLTQIYHNNFINNVRQIELLYSPSIIWDNGCEGNYWSDYNGTDTDGDGVGDTFLPWQGVDYYPLMNLFWNPADVNYDLKVDGRDIAIVAKAFGSYYPDHATWNPHADVSEDRKIDGKDIAIVAKNFGETYP